MSTSNNNKVLIFLAFLSIYVIWGTTFLAISYGLKGFSPFLLSGFRFFTAGLILLTWLYLKGEKPFSFNAWKRNSVVGILILTVGVGSVTWAEQYISSTEAAIIIASEPFWFILIDKKNRSFYFNNKLAITGLLLGLLGLILFFKDSLFGINEEVTSNTSIRIIAFVILVFTALVWVFGSLYSKKQTGASIFMNVAQQLIAGGTISLILAGITGEWGQFNSASIPSEAWAGLLYLIFFGTIIAYLSFIWLLSLKPAALVSTHTFVNPIVAVFAGVLIAGETISFGQSVGVAIIISGVILTNLVQYKLSKRTKVRIRRTGRMIINPQLIYKRAIQF
jgi:drug/metabolite transporter (DMT)-like permease